MATESLKQITAKYKNQVKNYDNYIDKIYDFFVKQCEQRKNETEQAIANLPESANKKEQVNRLKAKLKINLDKLTAQYESALRDKFIKNINQLEHIYEEKEDLRVQELDQMLDKLQINTEYEI